MKQLVNKAQKVFDQCVMVLRAQGKSHKEAQDTVLVVVSEFKKPNMTKEDLVEMIATLEMTFLAKYF
jgi:hypothetical protein